MIQYRSVTDTHTHTHTHTHRQTDGQTVTRRRHIPRLARRRALKNHERTTMFSAFKTSLRCVKRSQMRKSRCCVATLVAMVMTSLMTSHAARSRPPASSTILQQYSHLLQGNSVRTLPTFDINISCLKKGSPTFFSCNSNKHVLIFISFGKSVTERFGSQKVYYFLISAEYLL